MINEWIDIKDHLPAPYCHYLITVDTKRKKGNRYLVKYCFYMVEKNYLGIGPWVDSPLDENEIISKSWKVTHWMDLPKPQRG